MKYLFTTTFRENVESFFTQNKAKKSPVGWQGLDAGCMILGRCAGLHGKQR